VTRADYLFRGIYIGSPFVKHVNKDVFARDAFLKNTILADTVLAIAALALIRFLNALF
jgi:hypothetical protein